MSSLAAAAVSVLLKAADDLAFPTSGISFEIA
jgi:hypothetical protein